jgi:hypothetical protein
MRSYSRRRSFGLGARLNSFSVLQSNGLIRGGTGRPEGRNGLVSGDAVTAEPRSKGRRRFRPGVVALGAWRKIFKAFGVVRNRGASSTRLHLCHRLVDLRQRQP